MKTVKIIKSYKFRLYPTEEQNSMLLQHGGNVRFTWNNLLDFQNNYHKKYNLYPTQSILQKKIIELKKEFDFLKTSHSQPLQVTAQRMVKTTITAFKPEKVAERNKKIAIAKTELDPIKREKKLIKAMNYAFPHFKSKHENNDAIFYPQNFKIRKSKVFFAKLGWINFKKHRQFERTPKLVTIKQDGKQWFVSISCEIETKEKVVIVNENSNIVGADLGIGIYAAISDDSEIANPKHMEKHQRNVTIKQRRLDKKEKNSKQYNKQKEKLQKAHRKIRNVRNDFLHKTTHQMITKYDGFVLETLDIREMVKQNKKKKKSTQNRNTYDAAWNTFGLMLEYKSKWNGKYFERINQWEKSTQTCSQCGHTHPMTLADRAYKCPVCGLVMQRDHNSSHNVLQMSEYYKIYRLAKADKLPNTTASVGTVKNACGAPPLGVAEKQEKFDLVLN